MRLITRLQKLYTILASSLIFSSIHSEFTYSFTRARRHACARAHSHTHIRTHAHTHARTYARTHTHTHTHTHARTHARARARTVVVVNLYVHFAVTVSYVYVHVLFLSFKLSLGRLVVVNSVWPTVSVLGDAKSWTDRCRQREVA